VTAILASGYDSGPAGGPAPGFHEPRGCPSWVTGTASSWSGGLRERVDALPRSGDGVGPWPGGLDVQAAPPAADQSGRGVQHPVPQRPGLGSGQVAVQGQHFQPGEQDLSGHRGGQPRGVDLVVKGGEMAQANRFKDL
jgi:hypothetical protein